MHRLNEHDAGQKRLRLLGIPRNAPVIFVRQRAWVAHLVLEEHSGQDSGTGWAAAR